MSHEPDDDRLLRDLASLAREEELREAALLDGRWVRLAAGELSPEEIAALEAEAETSEEARRRYEMFRPLGEDFQTRVVARILLEQGAKPAAAPASIPTPRPLRSEPRPRRKGLGSLGWRGLLAAAALVGAFVFGPRLLVPRFPAYEIAIHPEGEAKERSLEVAPPEAPAREPALFHPGTAFEVAVRPLAPIEDLHGELEVRCLLQAGARLHPWPSCAERAEIDPRGHAVRIAGTLGEDLTLEPGSWTLWVVLGRRGKIADLEGRPGLLQGELVARRNWIALRIPRPLRMEPPT